MMRKIFLIALLFVSLASCKSKTNAALKYNQDIVAKDKTLQIEEQTTENKVTGFYNEGKYDSIGIAGAYMEGLLQKAINDIDAMPAPQAKGFEDFKVAVLKYFNFFKSLYTVYREYGLAGNNEKREELVSEKEKLIAQRDDVVRELQHAQKIFSEANDFRMR